MSAYADSSFLLKLYIREPETMAAWQVVNSRQGPLSFTNLLRLEMTNGIRRCAASRKISKTQAARALRLLRAHLQSPLYARAVVHWDSIYRRALRLSRKHAETLHVRSLDLLHVATALEIGATEFLSFDDRQRRTARAEGLNVLP